MVGGRPVTVDFVINPCPRENLMMLGQESQINEDLDPKSGEEPLPRCTHQTQRIDMLLARVGIIPTNAIDTPKTSP